MTLTRPKEETIHVVLVEPEIHWNTGNAGRTCLAAGARLHLVEPLGFSLDERQVRRAGLDYWSDVELSIWTCWDELEEQLPRLGRATFFTPDAERTLWEVDLRPPCVLVFGTETRGLPTAIVSNHRSRLARIPQVPDSVRSLNLSTCVGIAVYEALRQGSSPYSITRASPSSSSSP